MRAGELPLLFAGNWKMNHGPTETRLFFKALSDLFQKESEDALFQSERLRVIFFPPAVSLATARACLDTGSFPLKLELGAQNAHPARSGAYTGELSGPLLKEVGATWVLVGHSERRQLGESEEKVVEKACALLEQGFSVIFCLGERGVDREVPGGLSACLHRQLSPLFRELESQGLLSAAMKHLVLAYEPVWAIGTGKMASPAEISEALLTLRTLIPSALSLPLLYGGSVQNPSQLGELLPERVQGTLVGGGSLQVSLCFELIRQTALLAGALGK